MYDLGYKLKDDPIDKLIRGENGDLPKILKEGNKLGKALNDVLNIKKQTELLKANYDSA